MTPPPARPGALLIGDATQDDLDPDAPAVRALELAAARTGIRIVSIPVANRSGVAELLNAVRPGAVVIAGGHATDDEVARFAYAVRSAGGALPLALFHRGATGGEQLSATPSLPVSPSEATAQALALLDGHSLPIGRTRRIGS
jgi:hypothetical protein